MADIKWLEQSNVLLRPWQKNNCNSLVLKPYAYFSADYFAAYQQGDLTLAFALPSTQQVLCAQRSGSLGSDATDKLVQPRTHAQGLLK